MKQELDKDKEKEVSTFISKEGNFKPSKKG